MKALVVRAPMQFEVEEVPVPRPAPGGLLLEVTACGLCGSDLRTLRMGHHRVTFPWIIGHEIAGRVVELGAAYQGRWRMGEILAVSPLAYCGRCDYCANGQYELCEGYREIGQHWPGGFADYIAIPEECIRLGTIRPVPEGLDPAYAAISEPISSSIHAQEKGLVGLGDTVVIIGAGPVGCINTSLARARGADKVFVVDINPDRLRSCAPFAPDAVIDASQLDLVAEVRRLTGGRGADVVITATPAPEAQVQATEMAAKGGRILLFGGLPKGNSRPDIDTNLIHYNGLHVMGTTIFAPRHQLLALKLLASGRIPADRLVTNRFPLSQFKDGAALALDGKALKAVFFPNPNGAAA